MLEGLRHCGEHLREAMRGARSVRFTVSPALISKLFWGFSVCVLLVGLLVVCVCGTSQEK